MKYQVFLRVGLRTTKRFCKHITRTIFILRTQTPPRNTLLTRNQGARSLGSKVSKLPNSLIPPSINTPSPQNKEITKGKL